MTIAVQAPFNTTPAYSGTFIPTLWSGKMNVKFYLTTVFGEIANTDYEGEIKGLGDSIVINNTPDIVISDYVVGSTLSYQVPVPNKLNLDIGYAKNFAFQVSDVLQFQASPNLMDTFSSDAAEQMAIAIDRNVLANTFNQGDTTLRGATAGAISGSYNLGSDTAPVVLSPTNVLPLITNLSSALDEQNVPSEGRWIVIHPYMRSILMQSPLAQAYVTGDGQSILRNGKIGKIDRFDIYVSNSLPKAAAGFDYSGNAAAGTAKRFAVMAGHKSAITFASQMTKMETLPNPNDFGQLVRGLNVYGYKVIKPTALALATVQ